jgi:hypothetical protein
VWAHVRFSDSCFPVCVCRVRTYAHTHTHTRTHIHTPGRAFRGGGHAKSTWQNRPLAARASFGWSVEVCGSVKRDLLQGKRDLLILAYLCCCTCRLHVPKEGVALFQVQLVEHQPVWARLTSASGLGTCIQHEFIHTAFIHTEPYAVCIHTYSGAYYIGTWVHTTCSIGT